MQEHFDYIQWVQFTGIWLLRIQKKCRSVAVNLKYKEELMKNAWFIQYHKGMKLAMSLAEHQLSVAVHSENTHCGELIGRSLPQKKPLKITLPILPCQSSLNSAWSFRCNCIFFYSLLEVSQYVLKLKCVFASCQHYWILHLKKKTKKQTRFPGSSFHAKQRPQKNLSSITACICGKWKAAAEILQAASLRTLKCTCNSWHWF